jgi:predicted RNase H-like HicB family nuclease
MSTSVKSRKTTASTSKRRAAKDRPFAPAILAKAKLIASQYQIVVRFDDTDQCYFGKGLEEPGAMGDGPSAEACIGSVREAMTAVVATKLERGITPIAPTASGARTEQVNVRLTPEERERLAQSAREAGYRGISDFVRAKVLEA